VGIRHLLRRLFSGLTPGEAPAASLAWGAGLLLGLLGICGVQAGGRTEPPASSRLAIAVATPRQKPPVTFSHLRHDAAGIACTRCHHDYQGRRNLWRRGQPVQQCRDCHGLRLKARRLDLKNAFHRQCKGCHLERQQRGRRAGPIACQDCHRQV
jgi:hypothetical protein